MKYVIVGSSKLPVPGLAREALQAVASAVLHGAATRPQSITANGPGHLLASPGRGPAASCPGLALPTLCGQEKRTQGAGPGFAPAPPPRRLGRRHKTPAQWVLGVDNQTMGGQGLAREWDLVQGL